MYDKLVGQYRLKPDVILNITKSENHLFAQATGQGRIEILPLSKQAFRAKNHNIELVFDRTGGESSLMKALTIHQRGMVIKASKIQ